MNEIISRNIIRMQFERLNMSYTRMLKNFGAEDIHRFRVDIKRIRAFIRLQNTNTVTPIEIPEKLKRVYDRVGVLRNLQLYRRSIKKSAGVESVSGHERKKVNNKLKKIKKHLKEILSVELVKKAYRKIDKKISRNINETDVFVFYKNNMNSIANALTIVPAEDEHLHLIRKNLKDIIYNAITFEKDLVRKFPVTGWTKEKEECMIELADQLGRFRDTRIRLNHLKKINHPGNKAEPELVKIIAQQQELTKHIRQTLVTTV
ncbi:MAG: CHAD domain-containing protein [Chitinophagaceae bacterium]